MADEKAAEAAAPEDEKPKASGGSKLALLLPLTNLVAVLATAGLLAYTKLVFKRPPITENTERARLAAEAEARKGLPPMVPGMMVFEPLTVNIRSVPTDPQADPSQPQQIGGKLHYVNLGMSLELKDETRKDGLEELRPVIIDRVISILGRRTFNELITVQGRYVLRTQLADEINTIAGKAGLLPTDGARSVPLITNVYFSAFMVQ